MTQTELAKAAGTSQGVISSRCENPDYGRQSLSTLFLIAELLGVFVDVEFKPADRFFRNARNLPADWLQPESFEKSVRNLLTTLDQDLKTTTPNIILIEERQSGTLSANEDDLSNVASIDSPMSDGMGAFTERKEVL